MVKKPSYIPPEGAPQVGQVVVFDTVPAGSWCRPGEAYKVTHGPRSARGSFRFESVERGSSTNDAVWAVRRATWRPAA